MMFIVKYVYHVGPHFQHSYPSESESESKVAQSCLTLCDPKDCSLPGSSAHAIFQARILEWLPFPSPGDLPNPGMEPASLVSPASAGGDFTTSTT